MTPKGCPIRDVAPDIELNERLAGFMNYKALSAAGAPQYLLRRVLKAFDLESDTDTLVALESVYARYQRIEAEKQIKKHRDRK